MKCATHALNSLCVTRKRSVLEDRVFAFAQLWFVVVLRHLAWHAQAFVWVAFWLALSHNRLVLAGLNFLKSVEITLSKVSLRSVVRVVTPKRRSRGSQKRRSQVSLDSQVSFDNVA